MHNQIQSKRILQHEHRLVLSQMLSGYLRHCELSAHLKGFVRDTFYFDGIKYCVPVFTFMGPSFGQPESRVVGIVSATDTHSDIALELIERLIVDPRLASGYYLRIVPVENPVAIEKSQYAIEDSEPSIREISQRQKAYCTDGLIELRTPPHATEFTIQVSGNEQAWEVAESTLAECLSGDDHQEVKLVQKLSLNPENPEYFNIRISIPKEKDNLFTAYLVNRFILRFLQKHAVSESKQMLSV